MKRRDFVKTSVAAGVVASTVGGIFDPFTVKAYANAPSIAKAAMNAGTGRVLVVIQLDGGNDGLNTIVPHEDPIYNNLRGSLAITNPLRINDTLGWHPAMTGLERLYNEGQVAIVQNVGYPNPNRSHFVSTSIWETADTDNSASTGWLGRYFDNACTGSDPTIGISFNKTQPESFGAARNPGVCLNTPELYRWTEAYVLARYVPEPRRKRKRTDWRKTGR